MSKHPGWPSTTRRRGSAAGVLLCVLLLHGMVLEAGFHARIDATRAAAVPRAPVRVRAVDPAPARNPPSAEPPSIVSAPATPARPRPARPVAASTPARAARSNAVAAASAPVAAHAAAGAGTWPVYAARPPPSRTLHYAVTQGADHGDALLRWTLDEGGYDAELSITLADGRPLLAWRSRGAVDAHGVAPQRLVEQRRRRPPRDVDFERAARQVRFSDGGATATLAAGAQDRLSWIAQLAAIAHADAAQLAAGREVHLQVAMAAGLAEVWTFEVLDADAGVHLYRAPRRPFDTELHVWLDPELGHWPRRLVQGFPPSSLKLELRLADGTQ